MVNEWFITSLNSKNTWDSHENDLQLPTKQRDGEKQDVTTVNFLQELQSPKGQDAWTWLANLFTKDETFSQPASYLAGLSNTIYTPYEFF